MKTIIANLMWGLGFAVCASTMGSSPAAAVEIRGQYLETRTCDVYTGPCFANSEVGLAGQEAIMAWSVDAGSFQGVELSGLRVVMAIRASDTLGFGGGLHVNPAPIRSVVVVDERASERQREALVALAQQQAGEAAGEVVRVEVAPIDMQLDHIAMVGKLRAGSDVALETRKLEALDHCCTNEIIFYPPLARVENYEPAVTVAGHFEGRGLGSTWRLSQTRSAFLATFSL